MSMRGLFSSKTEITVFSSALHLADAGEDPIKGAVISSLISNTDLVESVLKTMFQGLGVKMRPAYNYARDHYTLGLPSGSFSYREPLDNLNLASVIADDLGYPDGVYVIDSISTDMSPAFAVLPSLLRMRGYKVAANTISIYPPGLPSYTYCAEQAEHGSYCIKWATPEKIVYVGSVVDAGNGNAKITYKITNMSGAFLGNFTETMPFDYPDAIMGAPYIIAEYKLLDPLGEAYGNTDYWLYSINSNQYPSLSGNPEPLIKDKYLPVIPIRYKNDDLTEDKRKDKELYKTSEKLLDKLSMDFTYIGERVEENPDVKDIDHAYVMFGVNLQTDVRESLWYLGEYFLALHSKQHTDENKFFEDLNNAVGSMPSNSTIVSGGSFEEFGLDLGFKYDYVVTSSFNGVIGNLQAATKKFITRMIQNPNWSPEAAANNPYASGDRDYDSWQGPSQYISQPGLQIDMQITRTTVRRVIIYGFECYNDIYKSHGIRTTLSDVANDDSNDNFVVPILYNLSQAMPLRRRNMLYTDGSLMILNSYVKTKVKWYAQGWFKVVLFIIVIVIAAWSGQAWLVGLLGAMGEGATALIMYLVITFAVAYIADYAFDWLVDQIGARYAIIAAVVIGVIGLGFGYYSSETFMILGAEMTTSQMMLMVSSCLLSSTNEMLAEEGQEAYDEYADFREEMVDRWEELETAEDLLKIDGDLDPLMFTAPSRLKMYPSENPTQFVARCLELPSYSTYGIHDEIPEFFDRRFATKKTVSMDLYNQNIHG